MKRSCTSKKTNLINKLANDSSVPPNFQASGFPSIKNNFEWMNKVPLFIFAFFIIMGFSACGNDEPEPDDIFEDYCSTPLEVLLKDESNNVSSAHIAYINDFNVANCNAYLTAYDEYLGALYIYRERCEFVLSAPALARMEDAIQNAESDVNGLDCE